MNHYLTSHTTRQLLNLKTDLQGTLRNPKCAPIVEPVSDTIAQINSELASRGILSLKKSQQ